MTVKWRGWLSLYTTIGTVSIVWICFKINYDNLKYNFAGILSTWPFAKIAIKSEIDP